MIEKYSYGEYVIVYNGQIYNTKELREILIELKGICNKIGLKVYNSEEENFTDKLDAKLQKEKSTESKSIQNDEEIK